MWGRLTKHTAGEEEYGRTHCGIDGDPLDQTDAGRRQEQSQHHQGRNHGHDLFSASLARTCSRDVLADLGSAIRALAGPADLGIAALLTNILGMGFGHFGHYNTLFRISNTTEAHGQIKPFPFAFNISALNF